jgi:hypothetical protein
MFRCRRHHEHGHIFRECPLNKQRRKQKQNNPMMKKVLFDQITKVKEIDDKIKPSQQALQKQRTTLKVWQRIKLGMETQPRRSKGRRIMEGRRKIRKWRTN